MAAIVSQLEAARLSDEELVRWVVNGEIALFELLMRRHNQRLYRAARAILRDDTEAEDVVQEAWIRGYQNLRQFEGRATFSTWVTRIAVHEALHGLRRRRDHEEMDAMQPPKYEPASPKASPEVHAASAETQRLLEQAIDTLPDSYREVFVLRDVEEMSTIETAEALSISTENVKVRLHRARTLLRKEISARFGATSTSAFHFLGARCDRMVANVMARITAFPSA
jgi:RNA polymerase sigma-70 factor (ECF subfamily)